MASYRLLPVFLVMILLTGCDHSDEAITRLSQLAKGKTFAVPTGTVADQMTLEKFPDATIEYYNSVLDCALAVKEGKADAAIYDLPVLKNIVAKNQGLTVLPELLFDDQYGFAVQLENRRLKEAMDTVLATLKADGTYDDMVRRWLPDRGSPAPMPDISLPGTNGTLLFGTAAVTEPMSFMDAEKRIVGFDVEFAARVAQYLGMSLEVVDMEFGAMLPALIAGKVDMIGAGLSITEERKKKVLFSECYYQSGIAAVVRSGQTKPDAETETPVSSGLVLTSVDDIADKRVGVLMGSIHDAWVAKTYPEAEALQFMNVPDMLFALNSGKVDVVFTDQAALPDILEKNPGLGVLTEVLFTVPIAAGFNSDDDSLRLQFNLFLREIRTNGIYDDMVNRWMKDGPPRMPVLPPYDITGPPLRNGIVSDLGMPFIIMKDGSLQGFDIELSTRFAARLGRSYEPADMPFGSLIASISTQKIDLITSSMMITAEREKQIDFSDPYYESGASLLARKENLAATAASGADPAKPSFFRRVADSFYNNIIYEKRYLHILDGLKVTIIISVLAALIGTLIGAGICAMRMSKRLWVSAIARAYISLLRGTPVLVLLMIVYYVVFAKVNINPVLVAILAFGMNFGAYVSEMFRTGIEGIGKGQREAATAGGFTRLQTFRYIILPQAVRHILPVYKGEFISLIKMTSIVGYIAVQDLTKASDIIRSRTFDAFFPLIMVAVIYLFLAWLLTRALDMIEVSADPRRRRSKRKREVRA